LNQANGSIPARWQEATKLRNTAAVLPPWSLPKKIQLRRPTAIPRIERSVVVDLQVPIVTVTIQRRPILQRVTHGAPRRTLRPDFCLDLFQVVTQLT